MMTIPLSEAALCASCDCVYPISERACPSCTTTQRLLLGRIIRPMREIENEYQLPEPVPGSDNQNWWDPGVV